MAFDPISYTLSKRALGAIATDVGAETSLPFVVVCAGQSNALGQDHNGSHAVGANILITNDKSSPTALITAAYGTNPLHNALAGTTTDPTQAYCNQGIAFANALRASGMLPAARPIIVVPDWEPSKSISNWTRSVGYDAYTVVDMWARLQAQLAVVQAAYPGFSINHVIWSQGENDSGSSSSFNTRAGYLGEFATLVAKFQALPQWSTAARMTVTELGTWANNTGGQARNDALRILADGATYPFLTLVTSAGLTESTDNPGPHYDGASLNTLGQRHFQAWAAGRMRGTYAGARTSYGSALAFPNVITASASGQTIHQDDVRSGALILGNGGTVTLPNLGNFVPYPIRINAVTQTVLAAQGTLTQANVGTTAAITMKAGQIWDVSAVNATTWRAKQINPNSMGQGDSGRYIGNATYTGTQTFTSPQLAGVAYTISGATVTITPTFGSDVVFVGGAASSTVTLSAGNFIRQDGTTTTSLTVLPGETAWLVGGISGTSTLSTYVMAASLPRIPHGITSARPALTSADRVQWFDDTLGKPVWWNGTAWKDAAGTTV